MGKMTKFFLTKVLRLLQIRVEHDAPVANIYTYVILASHLPYEAWVGSGENAHFLSLPCAGPTLLTTGGWM